MLTQDYNEQIEKTGLKKVWLAGQLGVSKVTFSYWINGTRHMPDDMKKKLDDLLKPHLTRIDNGV